MNRVVHVFKNVNMLFQHDKLIELAASKKVDLKTLAEGQHVVFLNKKLTRIKLFSQHEVISYYRHPNGDKINLEIVGLIPKCFDSKAGAMNWDKAERMALEAQLARK